MIEEPLTSTGEFLIGDKNFFGTLRIDGKNSNLSIHSSEYIALSKIDRRFITGVLSDHRCVSLIDCNVPQMPAQRIDRTKTTYSASIFPHYVAIGNVHIDPDKDEINRISWVNDDLTSIFNDFDSFGSSPKPGLYIKDIVRDTESLVERSIAIGEYPAIQYFTGRFDVFFGETAYGDFCVQHSYTSNFGGARGVRMDNQMRAELLFRAPQKLKEALKAQFRVTMMLSLICGRPQNIEDLQLTIADDKNRIELIASLRSKFDRLSDPQYPAGPQDMILGGTTNFEDVRTVLRHWTESFDEMSATRIRLWHSFSKQNFFDADRMIAAANLFDTIPSRYFPTDAPLTPAFAKALGEAKNLFKDLPATPEKESVMRELSRISRPTLRTKIKHWAAEIIDSSDLQYEDLPFVIDRAVKCRNYYVHGGRPEFDYEAEFPVFVFMIRVLELCYILPEFMRSGWRPHSGFGYHPFSSFSLDYHRKLARLRELVDR